jgi:hypothetical protein
VYEPLDPADPQAAFDRLASALAVAATARAHGLRLAASRHAPPACRRTGRRGANPRPTGVGRRTAGRGRTAYEDAAGRSLDRGLLDRYRIAWSLADVAAFVTLLRGTSDATEDTAWSWDALRETLAGLGALT